MMYQGLEDAFIKAEDYSNEFNEFADLYIENLDTDLEEYDRDDVTIAQFRELLVKYQAQIKQFEEGYVRYMLVYLYANTIYRIASTKIVGIIHCNSIGLRQKMLPSPVNMFRGVTELLPRVLSRKAQKLLDEVNSANERLQTPSPKVELFVEYIQFTKTTEELMPEYEERYANINQMNGLLEEYSVALASSDREKLIELKQAISTLKALMAMVDETIEKSMFILMVITADY